MANWEYAYELYVDGKPMGIEVLGSNKTEAWEMVEGQWKIVRKNEPLPKRYRCKLEIIEGPYPGA